MDLNSLLTALFDVVKHKSVSEQMLFVCGDLPWKKKHMWEGKMGTVTYLMILIPLFSNPLPELPLYVRTWVRVYLWNL